MKGHPMKDRGKSPVHTQGHAGVPPNLSPVTPSSPSSVGLGPDVCGLKGLFWSPEIPDTGQDGGQPLGSGPKSPATSLPTFPLHTALILREDSLTHQNFSSLLSSLAHLQRL